jgi:hypothetical protein
VEWDPPDDVDGYVLYVPSRNIKNDISSNKTLTTLTVPNCDDDDRVQVAAVNSIGCVGMKSSQVRLTLLDIPTAATDKGSDTTINEGGLASTSSKHLHVIIK